MQEDFIKVASGLPELIILDQKEESTHFDIRVMYRRSEAVCHRLAQLFATYPALKKAWELKEQFREWYRLPNRNQAEIRLKSMEQTAARDDLPEFEALHYILTEWRGEILNYFDHRITNGFVEGKNNRIKTLKRMAYGYRNMANFRLRILATNRPTRSISPLLT